MKSPKEIYELCPELQDIANRLADSEKEVAQQNENRKNKDSNARALYPEHCRITQIYVNNHWDDTVFRAKPGKEAFEEALVKVVNSRSPHALRVAVYNGKRTTSNHDLITCYLAEDAKIISEIKGEGLKGPNEEGLSVMKTEIEKLKNGKDLPEVSFTVQLLALEHKHEIQALKLQHERELEKKDRIIEDLQDEIEELEQENEELDGELGSAADKILEKVGPKPAHIILAKIAEQALEGFILNRPRILKEAFKLNDDEIKAIFSADAQKQITPNSNGTPNSGAEFSEANATPTDEYKDFDPQHAEALKNIHLFNKSLPVDKFKMLYNVFAFCCKAEPEGEFHEEHVNMLLAYLIPIAQAEEEAKKSA